MLKKHSPSPDRFKNSIEEDDSQKRQGPEERKDFDDSGKELMTNKNTEFTTNDDSKLRNNNSKDLITLNPQDRV